jgi:hypothetical protein
MSTQTITVSFNTENTGELSQEQLTGIKEMVAALCSSGGLTGVKQGRTILHFDSEGTFQGVELQYWPWRKRKK